MNRQHSAEGIFGVALDLPTDDRGAYLDQACRGSRGLRKLVDDLIADDRLAGSFLGKPLLEAEHLTPPAAFEAPAAAPRFKPSEIIADRFIVVRFIARGGMGEVYEVQDQLLQGAHVALKIIRPEIAADVGTSHRFEQEVLLARAVNHPNLCPIYELFHCEQPAPAFLFLTMKLLRGETLEARLRTGRLARHEAVEICCGLIAGVYAIHSAGIIHRDIKPSNVMLGGSGSGHAVSIMDFGLARLPSGESAMALTSMIAGTPGFLAPELLQGFHPTPATDLFALGVVLHQVLTGERLTYTSRQNQSSLKRADAPSYLTRAVASLVAEDPAQRLRAFEQLCANTQSRVAIVERPSLLTRRHFAMAAAAAFCAAAGGLASRPEILDDALHPLPSKRFVALLNWPPPVDVKVTPMLLGLIDTMANELARAEAFDHNFFVAAQPTVTRINDPKEVNLARESLGANLVLAASASATPEHVNLLLQVIEPNSFRQLRSRELRVPLRDQLTLPARAVRAAAELLDVTRARPDDEPVAVGTASREALAAYQSAQAQLRQPNNGGLDAAIESFKQAIDADPHFANAHARLAFAYTRLYAAHGEPSSLDLARANAETALDLDRNCVEGHNALGWAYLKTGENEKAVEQMALALALDPRNATTMTYQAHILTALNRWQEAEEAYKRILRARPNYWMVYNELGYLYSVQGKYKLALAAFQSASISAPKNSLALNNEGSIYFYLGDFTRASATIAKSLALAPNTQAFQTRADILRAQGRFAESLEAGLQAVKLHAEESTNWLRVADAYALLPRHHKDAQDAYQRGGEVQTRQLEVNPNDGPGWMCLALFRIKTGDLRTPPGLIEKAEALGAVTLLAQLQKARILELLGHRNDALASLAECVQRGATEVQIEATHDLDALRSDTRYNAFAPSRSSLVI